MGFGVLGFGQAIAIFFDDLLGGAGEEVGVGEFSGRAFDIGGVAGDFLGEARALGGEVDELGDRQCAGGLADDEGRGPGRSGLGDVDADETAEGQDQVAVPRQSPPSPGRRRRA